MSTSSARPYRVAWTLSDCAVQVSDDLVLSLQL